MTVANCKVIVIASCRFWQNKAWNISLFGNRKLFTMWPHPSEAMFLLLQLTILRALQEVHKHFRMTPKILKMTFSSGLPPDCCNFLARNSDPNSSLITVDLVSVWYFCAVFPFLKTASLDFAYLDAVLMWIYTCQLMTGRSSPTWLIIGVWVLQASERMLITLLQT